MEEKGIACHLPQRDTDQQSSNFDKYTQNIEGIKNAEKLLTVGINESVNWGLETGFAFGSNKKIILLTEKDHVIPVMSLGMYEKIIEAEDLDNIDKYIDQLVEAIQN